MQWPFLPVLVHPVIVIEPVGQIGALLNFRHQSSRPNGMDGTRRDEKKVIPVNGELLQVFLDRSIRDCPAQLLSLAAAPETIDQLGVRLCVQHIPHLGFAQLAVFMEPCVIVSGMDLNGQVFFRVNELNEDGKPRFAPVPRTQITWVGFQHLRQRPPVKASPNHKAGAIRMGGAFPGFRQRGQGYILFKIIVQPGPAPEVILSGRAQQQRFILFGHGPLPCFVTPVQISACPER